MPRPLMIVLTTLVLLATVAAQSTDTAARKRQLLWHKMEAEIERADAGLDGVMGVAILDLTSGETYLHNAHEVFPIASMIKLPLLLELYRQEQRGRGGEKNVARLSDPYTFDPKDLVDDSQVMVGLTPGVTHLTNRDLAQFTVAVSDNTAANILIDRVGMENVNHLMRESGMNGIQLRRKMMDLGAARAGRENVATPREMVELLRAIYDGKVLDKGLTQDFLRLMATIKKSPVQNALPDDIQVTDKHGELEAVRCDSGIVMVPGRPFAISVMTAYDGDEGAAEQTISRVALAAYRYFDMVARSSEYGRVVSPKNGSH